MNKIFFRLLKFSKASGSACVPQKA